MAASAENVQNQIADEAAIKPHRFLNPLGSIQNCVLIQARLKLCTTLNRKNLKYKLEIFNQHEICFLVDGYLLNCSEPYNSPEFVAETRKQFNSLISHNCPAASPKLRILLDEVQSRSSVNSAWFTLMAEKIDNFIITPLMRMRVEGLMNEPGRMMRWLECQRYMLKMMEVLKDQLTVQSQELKDIEDDLNQMKMEARDCILYYLKLKPFIQKTCHVIPELNREADEDEEWMQLAKEEGLLPISLFSKNLDPK